MDGSKPFSLILGTEDWKKLGKSLLIAAAGAGAAWLTTSFIPAFSGKPDIQSMIITAAATWVVNTLRIIATDTTTPEDRITMRRR